MALPPDWIQDGPVPFRVDGHDIQTLEFYMTPGQKVVCEPDAFVCSAGGIKGLSVNFGRRLRDPIVRKWAGENPVMTEILCEEVPARAVLGGAHIGTILRLKVRPGQSFLCQRGAFMAATGNVDVGIAVMGLRAGFFGRQGFVFQRVSGDGDVFLHALGTVKHWDVPAGREVLVSRNNILAYEEGIKYDVRFSGGFWSMVWGSNDLFVSRLRGPGDVWVQSIDHGAFAKAMRQRDGMLDRAMRRRQEQQNAAQSEAPQGGGNG